MNKQFKKALLQQIAKNKIVKLFNAADHSYIIKSMTGTELVTLRHNHAYDTFSIIANGQIVLNIPNNADSHDIIIACEKRLSPRVAQKEAHRMTPAQVELMKSWQASKQY